MSTNISISDIELYFSYPQKADTIIVDENNINHYAPLPENYSEKDYKKDVKRLRKLNLKRRLKFKDDLNEGESVDNLSKEETLERKALKRRIAYYPIRDSSVKLGDTIERQRMRLVENESDLENVYTYHLNNRLQQNTFAKINYFIEDELSRIEKWLPNAEAGDRDMLKKYLELLKTKLGNYYREQEAEAIDEAEKAGKGGTTPQQVLAMHFIFQYMQMRKHEISLVNQAKFIEFLTGKSFQNIYTAVGNPLVTKGGEFRMDDLKEVRKHFEYLGLHDCTNMVNNELSKPRK